ncbi:type II pantothenate kinase [Salibacterium halotolerans]|uniref:Pantothenate kinase n=1 Tax=Salibacterium halotolerans TaxID=1884432 RepID=A0A1I5TW35_9BACI|nr:type II pantothenate kinase [Salibacterium halotolerans]SFP87101.1 pantothenate kinase [Salibacterium halotolerans]
MESMDKQYVGIDAGGTLVKIVYSHEGHLQFEKMATDRIDEIIEWINRRFTNPEIHITGGKAGVFAEACPDRVWRVNEFEATCEGVSWLLEKETLSSGIGSGFLVTNVGTGTSIHYVYADSYERIGGSGMGGGTLLGLSYLLTGRSDFETILEMGQQGNGQALNITVGDIYSHETPPISGALTASNFGHTANMKEKEFSSEDYIAAVVRMIGETITTMSVQVADRLGTDTVVYIGSTFAGHDTLKEIIKGYTELRGKTPYFLPRGEYSGAVGALLHYGWSDALL